ncbi:MHO_1580 family protein [Mycoplasma sp. 744]|uniref:MHO_1580 family protein n=1 Tax=Mycoplasma sp. 744 TaxID=3108531 RepID=UPI003A598DB1
MILTINNNHTVNQNIIQVEQENWTTYRKNSSYNGSNYLSTNGFVSIRRTYQDDNFFINATLFIKNEQVKDILSSINFELNGKIIELNKENIEVFEQTFDSGFIEDAFYGKIFKNNKRNNNLYKMFSFNLTSEILKTKFSNFKSFSIIFQNKKHTNDINFIRIFKENLSKKDYNINITQNKNVQIEIPYKWNFYFDNTDGGLLKENIYTTLKVNPQKLNYIYPTNKIAETELDQTNLLTNTPFNEKYSVAQYNYQSVNFSTNSKKFAKYIQYYKRFYPFVIKPPKYNLIFNNPYFKFKTELENNTEYKLYEKNSFIEKNKWEFNNFTKFDYNKNTVELSETADFKGLIIPFNANKFINTFNLNYDYFGNNKNNINIKINQNYNINKPLLDPIEGQIKIKMTQNSQAKNNVNYRYVINLEHTETFLNEVINYNSLERWLYKDEN